MLCLAHACVLEELAKYIVLICYNFKSLEIHETTNAFMEHFNRETDTYVLLYKGQNLA